MSIVQLLDIWCSGEGKLLSTRCSLAEGKRWRLGRREGEEGHWQGGSGESSFRKYNYNKACCGHRMQATPNLPASVPIDRLVLGRAGAETDAINSSIKHTTQQPHLTLCGICSDVTKQIMCNPTYQRRHVTMCPLTPEYGK